MPTSIARCCARAFARAGHCRPTTAPWLDLAALAAALVPDASRYGDRSLDDWLAAFGIECTIRHNAAADALATAELLLRLRAIAAKQGARGFDALVRAARQQKWLGNARLTAARDAVARQTAVAACAVSGAAHAADAATLAPRPARPWKRCAASST